MAQKGFEKLQQQNNCTQVQSTLNKTFKRPEKIRVTILTEETACFSSNQTFLSTLTVFFYIFSAQNKNHHK
jgi:hypothetical protein